MAIAPLPPRTLKPSSAPSAATSAPSAATSAPSAATSSDGGGMRPGTAKPTESPTTSTTTTTTVVTTATTVDVDPKKGSFESSVAGKIAAHLAAQQPTSSGTGHPGAGVLTPLRLRYGQHFAVQRFGGPAFEAKLDSETGSRARAGNTARMLFDGVQSFAERTRLIAGAKESIHLQTFIFTDDDTGQALAQQLIAKAKEGVSVRVIMDGLGSNRSKPAFFDEMRAAGVDVRARETGLDLTQLNNRWHEKHLVVDGKVAITGGMNIADEYALGGSGRQLVSRGETGSEPWRDVDVRIEGAAVHDEQRAFLRNWAALGGVVKDGEAARMFPKAVAHKDGAEVRVVQQHPDGDPPDEHILKLYVHAINAASTSITIENAYFVPPKELKDALVDAARRNVQVRVMTNSKESSDMGFVVDAARYHYDELLEAGVEIHEKTGGTLHSKSACFDGEYAIVGSYNLNGRSAGLDTEAVVAIRDTAVASSLDGRFEDGVASAKPVTRADIAKDTFVDDMKQWMVSLLSWTI